MKRSFVLRLFVGTALLVGATACQQKPKTDKPKGPVKKGSFFYEISKGGKKSFLLGTMHYGLSLDDVSPEIRPKLRATKIHMYEVLYTAKEAQYFFAIPGNPTNLYRSGLFETARAQGRRDLPPATIESLVALGVPKLVAGAMSDADCDLVYYRDLIFSGKSMDLEAQSQSRKLKKKIVVLDTVPLRLKAKAVDEESGLDFSCSIKEKILGNPKALREMDQYLAQAKKDYEDGNLSAFVDPTEGVKFRNKVWLDQIRKQLRGGSVFIAVGADHLHGPQGLIKTLRAAGYELRPVSLGKR